MNFFKFYISFICLIFALLPLQAQKVKLEKVMQQKSQFIIDKKDGLSSKMLAPNAEQIRKNNSTQRNQLRSQTSSEPLDLGNGMFLWNNDSEPTGSLLEIKVTANQWDRLISYEPFLSELMSISNRVYSKFNDDFDFIFFVLNMPFDNTIVNDRLGFYGMRIAVNNHVQGLGMDVYDDSHFWGSTGKLKSAMFFPYHDAIVAGPALHEFAHNWAAFICPTYAPDDSRYDGHWGVSNADGQLGGFKYIRVMEENCGGIAGKTLYQASRYPETNPDGSFVYGGFGINANGGNGLPYSDIELYLMGMKSAQELRDANFHLDIYSGNDYNFGGDFSFDNGYFYSTTKISYTIDDIIALNGERVPDFSASQKQFKVLTVALTLDTAVENYCNEIIQNINWFAGEIGDTTYPWLYNFSQATNNVGSLITDDVKNSLPQSVLSDIVTSAGTLAPAFNPYIFSYTLQVDASIENIDITGITDIPGATVTGNVTGLPLKLDDYTDVTITVTDSKGDSQSYEIFVLRGNLPPFSFTWDIDNAEQKVQLMLDAVSGERCVIDWGDGTTPDVIIGDGKVFFPDEYLIPEDSYVYSHTYNTHGSYTVTIYGENSDNCPLTSFLWNQRGNQSGYRITSIDTRKAITLKSITLQYAEIANIDISHSPDLLYLKIWNSLLTHLDVSKNYLLRYLMIADAKLTTLDVSNNPLLSFLYCDNNKELSNIDISKNKELWLLSLSRNKFTEIDVSNNPKLHSFDCWDNQLTSLDLSKNPKLFSLVCSNNMLTNLDLSNNTLLFQLYCPNNQFAKLDVSNNIMLEMLYCSDNQLTALDVSKNTALTGLYCFDNQLTKLDVSNNPALKGLRCYNNQLSALDVNNNNALTELECYNNQLTTLDVSNNVILERLLCHENQLTELDVSNNTALTVLLCNDNQLSTLDVSNKTALTHLYCYNNKLIGLYLTGLNALNNFYGDNQNVSLSLTESTQGEYTLAMPLNNPFFDNPAISYADGLLKSTNKTVTNTIFSVQTGKNGYELSGTLNLSYNTGNDINHIENVSLKVYPNPVKAELQIESGNLKISQIRIVDLFGKTIYQFSELENQINVSSLSQGIYFVKLTTEKGILTKKFIKE